MSFSLLVCRLLNSRLVCSTRLCSITTHSFTGWLDSDTIRTVNCFQNLFFDNQNIWTKMFCSAFIEFWGGKEKTFKVRLYCYGTSSRIIFVHFLGELKTPNKTFQINWPLVWLQKLNLKTISKIFLFDMIDCSSGSPTCLKFDHISIRWGSLWTHVLSAKVSPNVCSTMPSWPSRDKNVPKMTLSPLWRFSHRAAVIGEVVLP